MPVARTENQGKISDIVFEMTEDFSDDEAVIVAIHINCDFSLVGGGQRLLH